MTSEAAIQQQILLALGARNDVRIWRNETATGWVGKLLRHGPDGHVSLAQAKRLHAGLCNGSADLIGIGPGGRMVAIEVKAPGGQVTQEQRTFLDIVRSFGGIAGVVTSPEEAKALVDSAGGE